MADVQKLFQIDIGYSPKHEKYIAQVMCVTEKKALQYTGSLKAILPKIRKAVSQKNSEIRRFPLPQESRILAPNGSKLMLPVSKQ